MADWREQFEAELRAAEAARAMGNEGRARVCARRAAGILIGEYLHQQQLPDPGPAAYERIRFAAALPSLPPAARQALEWMLHRVDEEFSLPAGVDLISEARRLRSILRL
ncbi:MAG: hypothetical protein D6803_01405 [Anaerolineae bacterium]|nr:MAG: hypothetical protein D6803_01405 [Anaerolineae bacterium]